MWFTIIHFNGLEPAAAADSILLVTTYEANSLWYDVYEVDRATKNSNAYNMHQSVRILYGSIVRLTQLQSVVMMGNFVYQFIRTVLGMLNSLCS